MTQTPQNINKPVNATTPDCTHWKDCGRPRAGTCTLLVKGRPYKENPTFGMCQRCDKRVSKTEPIAPIVPKPKAIQELPPATKATQNYNLEQSDLAAFTQRQSTCDACPQATATRNGHTTKCKQCGCSLPAKQRNPKERCPLNPPKWAAIQLTVPTKADAGNAKPPVKPTPPVKQGLLLKMHLCPGDVLMLTAAVRDLVKAHGDKFKVAVQTSCPRMWENNPHVVNQKDLAGFKEINVDYGKSIGKGQRGPYHFVRGYTDDLEHHLNLKIPTHDFRGEVYLSDNEKKLPNPVKELTGWDGPYWVLFAGGKYDFTAKWWNPDYYQEVVDHYHGKIKFVQVGQNDHFHPPLADVLNLIGKTDMRQIIRTVYHSDGVVSPVSFGMHLAAAVPTRPGGPARIPCVVLAGGREAPNWEMYPTHQFLHTVGSLDCCSERGCWKSKCHPGKDGKLAGDVCSKPVTLTVQTKLPDLEIFNNNEISLPACMELITPERVIHAIDGYKTGGKQKNEVIKAKQPTIDVSAMESKTFMFIGGIHRSGTTALWQAFKTHTHISGFDNVNDHFDEGQFQQNVYPRDNQVGDLIWPTNGAARMTESHRLVTPNNREKLFNAWAPYWDMSKPVLLEKTPRNLGISRFLQAIFPNSTFVFVVRNPIATAMAPHNSWPATRTLYTFEMLIGSWIAGNRMLIKDLPKLRTAVVVRYEDINKDPEAYYKAICQKVGLPPEPLSFKWDTKTNDKYLIQWHEYTKDIKLTDPKAAQLQTVNTATRLLGYDIFDWDAEPSAECVLPYLRL